ncbi:PAS domain S-box protein [Bradyrhizobium erythrophlei]|nr:PAS domain S-box protein [Bradyrhizobium erythrophlei]
MEITHKQRPRLHAVAAQFLLGIAGVALITFVCFKIGFGVGRTSLAYLIWIALVSLLGSFVVSVVLSIVAVACLNYFFVPPLFEFRVDDPDDILRIAMFLTTSLVVTALTTKLRRVQEELGETNLRLETAHRIAHVGWWQHDLITDRVTVSAEVGRILGMRPVAPWLELIHPEDRARVADAAAAAVRRGGPRYDVEYRVLRPDGALRIVHSQGDVTWDGSGRPLRKFGVLQDITELKQAERELRASEARFRTVVDHATDAFFLYNEDATVLDVNRQACESLGYRRDELIGMTAFDYGPDLTPALLQRIRERLRGGKIVTYDGRHRRKDGTVFPVEVSIRELWHEGQMLAVSLDRDITERKRAEQELRASEGRFRIFVDHATDAFLLLDDDWTILDVNRQACHGLGYSREELIGKHKSDFDVGLDGTSIQRLKQRTVAGEAITFETRHRRKDGTSFPVEVRLNQFEQGGRRYLCLVRDISERKRAEDELRESEERFRTIVQFSFDVYWESDAQHRFIRQVFAEGLADAPAPGSEIGKTRWEVPYLEPDAEAWRKHRETLDAHLPFRDFELARPASDGGKRYVSVYGLPVFDKSGRFIGYRGVGRHITERKRVEEALRRSEAYLAEAQRLSHTGTLAFNATAAVYWSEESYRIWGFDPLQGLPDRETVLQRIHPDDRERVNAATDEALHARRDLAFEFRIVLPDGTVKYIEATGQPMLSAQGERVEMVATHIDVTERKRAQEEHERLRQLESNLAHMNRVSIMGELAASLAHEILHPIATARNNARAGMRFLEMSPPNLPEVKEALACIVRDADRAKGIVDRMRDHIQKAPPRSEPFDLNEAIDEVIEMVQSAITKNGVLVRTTLKGSLLVHGDRVQLQQVILNLILNAVEAMSSVEEDARELSISTKQGQTSDVLVAVQDSGPGIDPERLDKVFAAFYTTKNAGIGMGLSICRSIITAHGGRLWAEANRPRGAVFQFTLPASPQGS